MSSNKTIYYNKSITKKKLKRVNKKKNWMKNDWKVQKMTK